MIYIKIATSVMLGFLIGLEREYSHRYIGIRTVSLVSLAATLFCIVQLPGADPTRIVGQVVTGMGFLGAGVIFKEGASIKGMTTAATLWCAAAIGSLVALDYWREAVVGTLCVIFINLVFKYIKIDKDKNKDKATNND
ncbi:MAG: MgtC/SapB family protein [Paludibacteraceae bacterium]|nr:MgtC/SapB family protein [Paludibacteraceae bacterium]